MKFYKNHEKQKIRLQTLSKIKKNKEDLNTISNTNTNTNPIPKIPIAQRKEMKRNFSNKQNIVFSESPTTPMYRTQDMFRGTNEKFYKTPSNKKFVDFDPIPRQFSRTNNPFDFQNGKVKLIFIKAIHSYL